MTISDAAVLTQIPNLSTHILSYESLFARLHDGHTLVTGNSRLARVLTSQYNQWRISRGDTQWQSPRVISWSLWVDLLWEMASLQGINGTDRAVPGNRQLISLWESTLKSEPLAQKLLRPESLAGQLRDTRKLITEWHVDLRDSAWLGHENENHAAFYQWNKAFEQRCTKGRWISPEDRSALISKAIRGPLQTNFDRIDLLGFDEFSPAQAEMLKALIEQAHPVSLLTITTRRNSASLWKSRDSKDELQQMARWVRYWHEKEPDATIAIVVPDLQTRRQQLERLLEEILTPGPKPDSGQNATWSKPWNISMGIPLARVPMIETAFDLFKLLDERIDIQDIGRVLRSPWLLGAVSERNQRALLEKCLRENYPRQLTLGEVWYRSSEIKTRDRQGNELPLEQHEPQVWHCPELTIVLNTLKRFNSEKKAPRPASAWAESFDRLLAQLGWPQKESLAAKGQSEEGQPEKGQPEKTGQEDDQSWQALQAWRDALRELASLDATDQKLGRAVAINQLKQICREKIFQAQSPAAAIQVLGLYEISGLRFDHLWVLGLHNDNWPASAQPNPFIPGQLQKAVSLPNSSPQRELKVARIVTRRLLETAPDCIFSYPGQHDGEDMLPSPLLPGEGITAVDEVPGWQQDDWRTVVASAQAPRIDPLDMPGELVFGTARGGSSILKNQALCPFRAFATNRLGAESLETPADGISPKLHGSLVHRVLELFWQETRTQEALLQLDDETLSRRVRSYVGDVTAAEKGLDQRPAFRDVEAQRLYRHVMDFMELDKKRESFEVVGFEEEIHPDIEGQTIRLFIDRVDRLPTGEEIIIDYKTGKVEPRKWFGDRPEDPQLPLYAISATQTPAAVAFGILRDDGCLYKGVVTQDGLLPDLPPKETSRTRELVEAGLNMPETIINWRRILHRLMADFLAGQAIIDPKVSTITCQNSYCELQSLCRVGELLQRQKSNEDHQQKGVLL